MTQFPAVKITCIMTWNSQFVSVGTLTNGLRVFLNSLKVSSRIPYNIVALIPPFVIVVATLIVRPAVSFRFCEKGAPIMVGNITSTLGNTMTLRNWKGSRQGQSYPLLTQEVTSASRIATALCREPVVLTLGHKGKTHCSIAPNPPIGTLEALIPMVRLGLL